jgi:hypothetical protein
MFDQELKRPSVFAGAFFTTMSIGKKGTCDASSTASAIYPTVV